MKPTELRFGNLVFQNAQLNEALIPNTTQPMRVLNIGPFEVELLQNEINPATVKEWIKQPYKKISGISITDERLLKFGFKYRNENRGLGAILDFKPKDGENAWKYSMSVAFVHVKDDPTNIYLSVLAHPTAYRLKYVHQLQNLYYSLTEEELIYTDK